MNIFFFHGKLSTPQTSKTAKAFVEYFSSKGHTVYVPDYRPESGRDSVMEYLTNYVKERKSATEENVFIGISLGGYWAVTMANMFSSNAQCVVLNPSLSYYYPFPVVPKEGVPTSCFLNMDDELLSSERTLQILQGIAYIKTYEKGGHRMSNILDILPDIELSINRESF